VILYCFVQFLSVNNTKEVKTWKGQAVFVLL
jgi:hypothetical protein